MTATAPFWGLYWMTAPLAWLYAIPVERFLSPTESVEANLWFLAVVAAWRVMLMIQVVSTLFHFSVGRAIFPVLLFADSVAMVILYLTPLPVVSIMGGIRLSESEEVIQATAFFVGAVGIVSWPIWIIGTVVAAAKPARPQSATGTSTTAREPVSQTLWGAGILSLAVWTVILPSTQPEQQRRRQVETLLREGQIVEALKIMSAHDRKDFPPHWDPPPRIGYGENEPKLVEVMETLITLETEPWVADLYLEKYHHLLGDGDRWHYYWWDLDEGEFDRNLTILENLPDDSPIPTQHEEALKALLENDTSLTASQKDRLRKLFVEDGND